MELTHEFTVPASKEETWAALNDIESVAGCFPGATVTAVEGDAFEGSCKVKLGPIALVYTGSGTFVDKDEAAGTMRIEAKGKDKRGNGTAGADVVATVTGSGTETTVRVVTDLAITGKPAQFGRGVMQDVSDKLLAQFVECLKGKVGAEPAPAAAAEPAAAAAGEPPPPPSPQPAMVPPPPASDDALDLGATVLPVLLRSYGPKIAVGLAVLVVLRLLLRVLGRR
ncbi:carbon monoxide dehydrogenase [Nocardioides gansuensis]|uniref:Carbon monoxide dehydrogenase n=1 Tax=Nocardioides gansuensis TaxID=2138300 RepID=A0A2T8FFZ7_9ACTN|nr:SRPBCC family protein [Nocardioides gansuensis]PVG84620.1 carbon monoxide dehydrogenase [Nocardioides gansuensis]